MTWLDLVALLGAGFRGRWMWALGLWAAAHTAEHTYLFANYLAEAQRFAQMAVDVFWQDNPLPRASKQTGHYEAITGGDSLALALLQVHAASRGLTNRIPSNTIDR